MSRFTFVVLVAAFGLWTMPTHAQDYRARVQGTVVDTSQGALPGVAVTLTNDATGVAVERVTDTEGRYLFDFVDPGGYTLTARLSGFKTAEQRNVRVQQRGDMTVTLTMDVGGVEETVTVTAAPVTVQFNTSSTEMTFEQQLIDQTPIGGRNPYNIAALDPTVFVSPATSENRPYHHAYANDYDAGGGTRRANDVLLDGVPLGASFKTSYTPAVDAVEEITVSKNSVDAENGNSLGGIISLNMKSGTNSIRGSGYAYFRDPSMNSRTDPTLAVPAGTEPLRGSELQMYGGTMGGPIRRNKIFSFTSFEQWNDSRPLSVVRTVPTDLERRGDFSQSQRNGVVRTIYNPFGSTLDSAGRVVRQPFAGNVIPSTMIDPVAAKFLQNIPQPNLPGNVDNLQYSVAEKVNYWNFSQRFDVNVTDRFKMFARVGIFQADLYQDNPIGGSGGGFFPLSGSNRDGMSIAGDGVWILSDRTTVNVRGSFYNMIDEFYNPALLLGSDGLADIWPSGWYESLYNSGYVYYPALDVTTGTGTNTTNRLGRQGREWYQHPDAWNVSARMNRYQGDHNLKWGGEMRAYYGEAARFEPINLVFNSTLTANSSDSPQVATTGNEWASFLLGALDNQSSARLVPLQTTNLMGYSAYFQDDWKVNDRLTLNLGVRWEYEPGATDPEDRLSQMLDLTQPIPEMQATPPNMPAQAAQLMAAKGYSWIYNGAWQFTTADSRQVWSTATNLMPRVGVNYRLGDDSVVRFAYARFLMPISNVRDTLGDFVNQYSGFAQTTTTLGLANGRPQQVLNDPFPANNPVQEPTGQTLGRYTGLGSAVSYDQYELRPQMNDRYNLSFQKELPGGLVLDAAYFFNWGSRVPYTLNLNMRDPSYSYEYGAALNAQVPNPFLNYLTPATFPGSLRNNTTVQLGSLLVPYPQYGAISQTNTNGNRNLKTHSVDLRVQRPFRSGISFLAAYAWQHDRIENWRGDVEQYQVLQSGGEEGWEWQPPNPALPAHRATGALTWELPVGRNRSYLSDLPAAADYILGGWQYTTAVRFYSGRPVLFTNANAVSGDPTLDSPTRDRWFDTAVFAALPAFTPRTNPVFYDGLNGPMASFVDMTLTKSFPFGTRRLEARFEAYNIFNNIVWDQPDTTFGSPNFGKVTRKRVDSYGREIQIGVRFVF